MNTPKIITVILNTNRREDTLACLDSLASSDYANHEVIVLDSASSDGSVEAIQQKHPSVHVMRLKENKGYAGNNNVGIQEAMARGADWVFVLNEDTVLDPRCLSEMIAVAERDAKIGIVGPMVYHHDEPTVIQSAGGRMTGDWRASHIGQNEPDRGQFVQPHNVQWISGCAILLRRSVIEQVGMLDERFFYYFEETEWCLRTTRAGWTIMQVPVAKLWHKGVQRNYQPKPSVTYYATRNRLLMCAKHRAPANVWVSLASEMGRTLVSWSIKPSWRHMRQHRDAMWRGLMDFAAHRWGQMEAA